MSKVCVFIQIHIFVIQERRKMMNFEKNKVEDMNMIKIYGLVI